MYVCMYICMYNYMGVICAGWGGRRGTYPPHFLFPGGGDNISIVPPPPSLFSSKFYITNAGNEAINNIINYILNTNKYRIIK